MSLETEIFTRATTHSGLSALIGTRCYPMQAPKEVDVPYITYELIGTPVNVYTDHDGATRWISRVQFNCFAINRDLARELGTEVFNAFHAWKTGNSAIGSSMIYNRFNGDDFSVNLHQEVVLATIDHLL